MSRPRTTSPSPSSRQNSLRSSAARSADLAAAGFVRAAAIEHGKKWHVASRRERKFGNSEIH
eukprot:1150222-Prymnesium_polylepis.1